MGAWYHLDALAAQLDMPVGSLKRSLDKRDTKKEGGAIMISEAAAKRVCADLGITLVASSLSNGQEPPAPTIVELTVYRLFANPRLLLATRDDTGELVRVKVPNNVNFQPRMKIRARAPQSSDGPQLYTLEGRCPRYRGRW